MKHSTAARILREMAAMSRLYLEQQPTNVEAQPMMQEQSIACDHAAVVLERLVRKGKDDNE